MNLRPTTEAGTRRKITGGADRVTEERGSGAERSSQTMVLGEMHDGTQTKEKLIGGGISFLRL